MGKWQICICKFISISSIFFIVIPNSFPTYLVRETDTKKLHCYSRNLPKGIRRVDGLLSSLRHIRSWPYVYRNYRTMQSM